MHDNPWPMGTMGSGWGGWVAAWLIAFVLTISIEAPIATALLAPAETSVKRRATLALFAQLVSHPAVWFVFPALGVFGVKWAASTALAEAWAFAIEAVFYRVALPSLTARRAMATSAISNAASFGAGLVLAPLLA